jgi:Fe-S oxidoreductase
LISEQIDRLHTQRQDALAIVGLEPSCLLSLVDEWPDLVPTPRVRELARHAFLIEDWLAGQRHRWLPNVSWIAQPEHVVLHGHCHQRALVGLAGTAELLRLVPGIRLDVLDTGCCGMAGAFGYEHRHFDLSVQIAELSLLPAVEAAPQATVLASGTSCRHQLRDLAGREALHPVLWLAQHVRS